MGRVNRRIGKSSETANVTADGTGGGVLTQFMQTYFNRSGNLYNDPGIGSIPAIQATGGVISEYTDSGDIYRAHTFTASGSFVVSDITSSFPTTAKILVVAGGGGGGGGPNWAGGGGAGGLLETTSFTLNQRTYPIVIGAGGIGGASNNSRGGLGGDTVFTDPGGPTTYTATGGGGGGAGNSPKTGRAGGSGGGAGENSTAGPGTQGNASPFTGYGNDGGGSGGPNNSSGGGGAGSTAVNITTKYPGTRYVSGTTSATQPGPNAVGGSGRANTFAYGPTNPQTYAGGGGCAYFDWDGPGGPNLGSGQLNPDTGVSNMNTAPGPATNSGLGGGGKGGAYYQGIPIPDRRGTAGTGGGGGGGVQTGPRTPVHPNAPQPAQGGDGGSGVVIVAYQIGSTGTAKATGGAISFYGGKTIHTFVQSGAFTTNAGFNETVEYVIVGGGGSGGTAGPNAYGAGGGGAGQMLVASATVSTPSSTPHAVLIGAGGSYSISSAVRGGTGVQSSVAFPSGTKYGNGGGGGGSNLLGGSQQGGAGSNHPSPGQGSGSGGGSSAGDPEGGDGGPAALGAYPGGDIPIAPSNKAYGGAGGGGAGGAGTPGSTSPGPESAPWTGGGGGVGLQAPTTFRNPDSTTGTPGPNPGGFYFAGGGAGGLYEANVDPDRVGSGSAAGGGGLGGQPSPSGKGGNGQSATGGGGGGAGAANTPSTFYGGNGGSGIVLIAYPT